LAAGTAFEFVAPAGELLEFSKAPRELVALALELGETEQHRPFLAARRPAGGQMREARGHDTRRAGLETVDLGAQGPPCRSLIGGRAGVLWREYLHPWWRL
jgi:hypothetical protein